MTEEQTPAPEPAPPSSEAKTFTQEQVNDLIAKEKGKFQQKYADYTDLKAKAAWRMLNGDCRMGDKEISVTLTINREELIERDPDDLKDEIGRGTYRKLLEKLADPSAAIRQEIAARHGVPEAASDLVGDSRAHWEADAAARAAIKQMISRAGELPTS